MNARQAAKKWKSKYEDLAKRPVPTIYAEPKRTETMTIKEEFYGNDALNSVLVSYNVGKMAEKLGAEIVKKCGRVETQDDIRNMKRTVRITVKAVAL